MTALFAACSGDDLTRETVEPAFAEGGYVKMNLRLPANVTTGRAANDDFNHGKVEEYTIKDATLVLFQGDDELTARFHSAYRLSLLPQRDGSSQVTSVSKVVKRMAQNNNEKLEGQKLYALVVINNNGLFNISEDNLKLDVNGVEMEGTETTAPKTFDEFRKIVVSGGAGKFYSANGGFLMTNAPLCQLPGGSVTNGERLEAEGGQTSTLAEVTEYVCRTETEAQAKPSTNVYVERAVAKVTMTQSDGDLKSSNVILDDGSADYLTKKIPWKVLDWRLDLTNRKSYLVRNYNDDWNALRSSSETPAAPYRFVGSLPVRQTESLYRTYWGEDPNYSDYVSSDFSRLSGTFDTRAANEAFGDDNPEYCMENTFDVNHQNQDRTTRAVVKVQIGNGEDLYTVNGDKTKIYTWEQLNAKYQIDKNLKVAIANHPESYDMMEILGEEGELGNPDCASYELQTKADGTVYVFSATITSSNGFSQEKTNGKDFNADKELNFNLNIKKYAGGITYYPLRIKHFGDDLTPWNNSADVNTITPSPTPGNIYPTTDANRNGNYLGRYGVLRNNWYNLTVNSIAGLGEPVVPPPTTDPDDELNSYISVSVNVLSWARRDQGAEF